MVGSTYDVVILSSSPPAASPQHDAPSRRVAAPGSSPLMFSPPASPLRTTSGASTTNPRAAPIPEGAVRGFATVGSLIRSERFTSRLDDDFTKIQEAHSRRREAEVAEPLETVELPRKPSTKKSTAAAGGVERPKSKPRARKPKPKSDKEILDSDDDLRRPQRFTKSPFFDERPAESAAKVPSETADAPKLTKSGKPRKPRAKKQKAEEEGVEPTAKPKRTRVTKSKAAAKGSTKQANDAPVVSAHFQTGLERSEGSTPRTDQQLIEAQHIVPDQPASIWDVPDSPQLKKATKRKERPPPSVAEGVGLDEAVARRRDWTPPRDTTIHSPNTNSTGKENRSSPHDAQGAFTNLLSNFAYSESHPVRIAAQEASLTGEVLATTKRRRVELVEIPGNQTNFRDSSPEKGKAPKKKPRTITDLVTGQYGPRDEESDLNTAKNDFFVARTSTTTVPLNDTTMADTNAQPRKQLRKRSSPEALTEKVQSKAKAKPKKASAKSAAKPKPVAEKLLSPGAAMLRLGQQDVLFGTSSQLALEESPTMIRQIQFAIKESERDADSTDSCSLTALPTWSNLTKARGKRGLWAASARDDEGGMLEHTEDLYIPEPDRTQDIPLLMDSIRSQRVDVQDKDPGPLSFVDIDDVPAEQPAPIAVSSDTLTPPRTTSRASQLLGSCKDDFDIKNIEFKDIDTFEQAPPPSNQNADLQQTFVDIDDFDLPPSAQIPYSPATKLRPPVPVPAMADGSPKKRGRPPKSQSAASKISASPAPIPKPSSSKLNVKSKERIIAPSTPLRASGRFVDIEEILDSDDDALEALSPTPPRVQKIADLGPLPLVSLSPKTSPSKTYVGVDPNLTPLHRVPTKLLEWAHIKATVFAQITTHIRSLPPTTDPANPTWHEKILMYDPIVLEELTAYLNTSTDIRTFKRATQKQVKAWNQQRKVDGKPALVVDKGEDGKGDGEDVLAVEKELETYMVQGWCESLSVCCIWGEGRGKGGVRKGLY
ncbi:hypothetical protein yc1106_03599 [Curvularia clavata]|uniref:Structure-specific endonuclease subunit SLX4 n=1 Tax=Curvularia clavata TaxID=95742 RepID=A0A9Q8Z6Z5_CURCL|nr:hypothetical protein yc1106_03599 [Curvularia clavata]